MKLLEATAIADNGYQMTWQVTVEREGSDKPACVAESITRRYA
jgi:acyl dehydratase